MAQVLVIDDSKLQRLFARGILSSAGHEVSEAADGESGLAAVRDSQPDCIVLDLIMPGITGQQVLETLRGEECTIPIVVVTADEHDEIREECLAQGATLVINKPKNPEELLDAVAAALA